MMALGGSLLMLGSSAAAPDLAPPGCAANVTFGLGLGGDIATKTATADWPLCCAECTKDSQCIAWTWLNDTEVASNCELRHVDLGYRHPNRDKLAKVSGFLTRPPPPPPTPPPAPPPAPAGTQKNVAFVLTDDQDLMLGSMRALPAIQKLVAEAGANLTHFRYEILAAFGDFLRHVGHIQGIFGQGQHAHLLPEPQHDADRALRAQQPGHLPRGRRLHAHELVACHQPRVLDHLARRPAARVSRTILCILSKSAGNNVSLWL